MRTLDVSGLEARIAVTKPTIIGAAFRLFLFGGTSLSEREQVQATGSPYLMKQSGPEILALVEELERRTEKAGV